MSKKKKKPLFHDLTATRLLSWHFSSSPQRIQVVAYFVVSISRIISLELPLIMVWPIALHQSALGKVANDIHLAKSNGGVKASPFITYR